MKISVAAAVFNADRVIDKTSVELKSHLLNDTRSSIDLKGCHAYKPLINSHDHLIGNWYPPAKDNELYPNAHIWVKEMQNTDSVLERNMVFKNNRFPMDFMVGNGKILALLGGYKNLFSGVTTVQDHAPKQKNSYYDLFPIEVMKEYQQCHSLTLGNFWGGDEPIKEWRSSKGELPFIVHLGEGLDRDTGREFSRLKDMGLLQPNTLLIHGISLTKKEIRECAEAGTSICWCTYSNYFLIGKTLDIDSCLEYGVNVVIGTDSTLSGSINLLHELQYAHKKFPHIPTKELYRMVNHNAVKALFLPPNRSELSEKNNENLLIIRAKKSDPFENLMEIDYDDIVLLIHKGKPLYGEARLLDHFRVDETEFFTYKKKDTNYFVIGHPERIVAEIEELLGHKKNLPYLPFQQ
jgi:hypothetical protein